MDRRLELQSKLMELIGSNNVYYQPPDNVKIQYPAIIYYKTGIDITLANNKKYISKTRYNITVIDSKPDNPVIAKILELPYSSYDHYYASINLNHDVITLYY